MSVHSRRLSPQKAEGTRFSCKCLQQSNRRRPAAPGDDRLQGPCCFIRHCASRRSLPACRIFRAFLLGLGSPTRLTAGLQPGRVPQGHVRAVVPMTCSLCWGRSPDPRVRLAPLPPGPPLSVPFQRAPRGRGAEQEMVQTGRLDSWLCDLRLSLCLSVPTSSSVKRGQRRVGNTSYHVQSS